MCVITISRVYVIGISYLGCVFFFNDTATTEIYTLSLHDALPICDAGGAGGRRGRHGRCEHARPAQCQPAGQRGGDRKSTRLNSSHANISYAVFCLKKKKKTTPLSTNRLISLTRAHRATASRILTI